MVRHRCSLDRAPRTEHFGMTPALSRVSWIHLDADYPRAWVKLCVVSRHKLCVGSEINNHGRLQPMFRYVVSPGEFVTEHDRIRFAPAPSPPGT